MISKNSTIDRAVSHAKLSPQECTQKFNQERIEMENSQKNGKDGSFYFLCILDITVRLLIFKKTNQS